MTLLHFTLKNLLRRPTRTILTIGGIGLGIGAVVALLGLAWGLGESWSDAYKARRTDLVVRKTGGGFLAQPFPDNLVENVRKTPGVAAAGNLLTEILSIEEVPTMVVSGREWGSFLWDSLELIDGKLPATGEEKSVVLGKLAAEMLEKKVGDTLTIEVEDFKVAAVVDGKAVVENGAIIMSLPLLQEVTGKTGQVNFINIRLDHKGEDPHAVAKLIEQQISGCRVDIADEVLANNDGVKTFEAMNWGTSAIAILVGTFGVMNTMFMSVFERSREIGILIALGWKRSRILRMIVWESVALCVAAGVFGIIAGMGLLKVLAVTPWMQGRLAPHFGWDLVGLAMGLAVVVGLASGFFPALHCTKINPSLAIRSA